MFTCEMQVSGYMLGASLWLFLIHVRCKSVFTCEMQVSGYMLGASLWLLLIHWRCKSVVTLNPCEVQVCGYS